MINLTFVFDKNNKRFNEMFKKIKETIEEKHKSYKACYYNKCDSAGHLANHGVCIYIFNDIKDLAKNANNIKIKLPTILLTENILSGFILDALRYVNDICYMKNDVEVIVHRIINSYKKQRLEEKDAN